jgi:proteasome alpha subunit
VSFMPYVAPEQLMKDRSDYAHKGIARGRSVIGLEFADGLLFLAENPSATLHKISEVYDQIAFAGVGKYSEALSSIFTQQMKPYEIELLVGEVDGEQNGSAIYHVLFDGSVSDEQGYVAMGGHAEELTDALRDRYQAGWDLGTAVRTAVQVLASVPETRDVPAEQIEAGVLDRTRPQRRKFRRLTKDELTGILAG